ncbi:MAG: site-specific DNA-methyltransferase [Erysipelotrichia bacterium]|nr:site-specific DNA-methyltransferase [Erysipelotrichia bacterium]
MKSNMIYLGDAYELIKEIPDKSIDLIITDPPYLMVEGGGGAFGNKNRPFQDEVDKLSSGITKEMLVQFDRVMKKTNIYIFCNKNQLLQYLEHYKDKNVDVLVWHKTNPIPRIKNKYLSDLEYIIFARDAGVPMYNTYETSSKLYQSSLNKADKAKYHHPTIKPLKLIENFIKNSSQEDDLVLDPFSGSGTTCVASDSLKRQYIGFEIVEDYYNVSIDRLNGITQQEKDVNTIFDLE